MPNLQLGCHLSSNMNITNNEVFFVFKLAYSFEIARFSMEFGVSHADIKSEPINTPVPVKSMCTPNPGLPST